MKRLKRERFMLLVGIFVLLATNVVFGLESLKQLEEYESTIQRQAAQLRDKQEQIEMLEMILEHQEEPEECPEMEYMGEFEIFHYCPCVECCGKTDGITFTGTQAVEGRTIAVDPEVIPLGSTVIIEGHEYIAEDIGGGIKGFKIDVFMDNHSAALEAGVVKTDVWIVEAEDEQRN